MSITLFFSLIFIFLLFITIIFPLITIKKRNKENSKKYYCKEVNSCDECEYGAIEVKLSHKKLFKKEKLK